MPSRAFRDRGFLFEVRGELLGDHSHLDVLALWLLRDERVGCFLRADRDQAMRPIGNGAGKWRWPVVTSGKYALIPTVAQPGRRAQGTVSHDHGGRGADAIRGLRGPGAERGSHQSPGPEGESAAGLPGPAA